MTKVIGYCTYGKHIRYVTVTGAALTKAQAKGGAAVEGICDSCQREIEKADEKKRGI